MTHPSRSGGLAHLAEALSLLEKNGLRRHPASHPTAPGATAQSFCSNDYLGLAGRSAPTTRTGAGASRLIVGDQTEHRSLEGALADWLGVEACLVFASGYAANVGTVSALAGPGDLIVSDALNHASLIDGARLSHARIVVVPHNDADAVARALEAHEIGPQSHAWVLVESYYSMDADGPDLGRLRRICDEHGAALLVDEAHAFGVLGPDGRGRSGEAEIVPDVWVGTLGKSLGSQGAFVAGSQLLRDWLWNRARSFVFSTGLAPVAAEAARLALEQVRTTPSGREHVLRVARRLREGLTQSIEGVPGLAVLGFGHIVPVLVGDGFRALRLAELLKEEGVDVPAIRPPTVPAGTARLRLTVTAAHREQDTDRVVAAFRSALGRLE